MSSYETAVVHLMAAVREQKPDLKTTLLPPFYQDPGYIDALLQKAAPSIQSGDFDKLVRSFFSFLRNSAHTLNCRCHLFD